MVIANTMKCRFCTMIERSDCTMCMFLQQICLVEDNPTIARMLIAQCSHQQRMGSVCAQFPLGTI
jgi:hypothetical protein